jgi:hypothetical protein
MVELPNGQSAVIASRDEISERTSRAISRAYMRAASVASTLSTLGFDETNPSTWTVYAQLSEADVSNLDDYQAELVVGLVRQWTLGDLPTKESALDLPKATFEALVLACSNEFNATVVNTEPTIDPLAPTAASAN